jgi:hypothetical protein
MLASQSSLTPGAQDGEGGGHAISIQGNRGVRKLCENNN